MRFLDYFTDQTIQGLHSTSQYGISHPRTLKGVTTWSNPNTKAMWLSGAHDGLVSFAADMVKGRIHHAIP